MFVQDQVAITYSKVSESEKLDFFPTIFPSINDGMSFETLCFGFARSLIKSYDGGLWDFYKLSNGSGFISLSLSEDENILLENNMNYFSETVDGITAGVIISLFSLGYLLNLTANSDEIRSLHNRLWDFANTLPTRSIIYKALD